jgi:hypothetical protein
VASLQIGGYCVDEPNNCGFLKSRRHTEKAQPNVFGRSVTSGEFGLFYMTWLYDILITVCKNVVYIGLGAQAFLCFLHQIASLSSPKPGTGYYLISGQIKAVKSPIPSRRKIPGLTGERVLPLTYCIE